MTISRWVMLFPLFSEFHCENLYDIAGFFFLMKTESLIILCSNIWKHYPTCHQRLWIIIWYRRVNLLLIILFLLRFSQSQICCFYWHSLFVFAYKYSCKWHFLTFCPFPIRKSDSMSVLNQVFIGDGIEVLHTSLENY